MKKEEISLKNTKAEILDALNEALEREKNNNKMKSNPEKEEKERKVKEAIEVSRVNVEQKIFSDELIKKYNDLELAIQSEEEKLKNLYGIEGELNNLTLVINAGKDFLTDLESKKELESEKLKTSIKELEDLYKTKSEELQKEYDLKSRNLKVERDRELEEYTYKTKREREIANNKWEDEKKSREVNLKTMEEETKKLLEEAREKENHLHELEKQVEEFPKLLQAEYTKGQKETSDSMTKENKYQMELLKKDFQNTIDRQADKIASLEAELEKMVTLNANLQEKTDKAYVQMKELATKTVEASGGVKILGNNQVDNK